MPISNGVPAYADYAYADKALSLDMLEPVKTDITWMFRRYLLQKAISVFKWQLPPTWDKDYFLYCLYCFGRVAVINTDKFGPIPQACGLMGYNVFYRPTTAIITNPLLTGIVTPRIGVECTVLKLQPDYGGLMDLVIYYSNLMGQAAEAIGINLYNSKVAYVFFTENKATGETFKKLYDSVSNGQPGVVVEKNLVREDGTPTWSTIQGDVKSTFITPDLIQVIRRVEQMFDTDIGIPNANTDKRERLISDEVNANNVETYSKCALWLEQLQESAAQARKMFGIDLTVDWRNPPKMEVSRNETV